MKRYFTVTILAMSFASDAADISQYAGQEQRQIKSMSEQEIAALSRGDGMGFAKAAELNQYPGPKHVLELAGELGLSAEQALQTRKLFQGMQAAAVDLGERLIAAEAELDGMFATGTIDHQTLEDQLVLISELRSKLRFVHLDAHLQQKKLLSQHQIEQYVTLRGYHAGHGEHH